MNQEETLALWKQGKEAWNAWAQEMLNVRKALEGSGEWHVDKNNLPTNDNTKIWFLDARVIFSSQEVPTSFSEDASFDELTFPCSSQWIAATFEGRARFRDVDFQCDVSFSETIFRQGVELNHTTFTASVRFNDATFHGGVWFNDSTFNKSACFDRATFHGGVWFHNTNCNNEVTFTGAIFENFAWFSYSKFAGNFELGRVNFKGEAGFDETTFMGNVGFDHAIFEEDASFHEATFSQNVWFAHATFKANTSFECARFDKLVNFRKAKFLGLTTFNSAQVKGAFDLTSAEFYEVPDFCQTHCEEAPLLDDVHIDSTIIKQRKSSPEPYFTVTANYRALKRLAIQGHDHRHEVEFFAEELRSKRLMVDKRWRWDWILSGIFQLTSDYGRSILRPFLFWLLVVGLSATFYLLTANEAVTTIALQCVKGDGWQWVSATQLAVGKGLLFPGIADRTLIMQAYDCLYGSTIPTLTSAVLGLQTLVSSALLFLILLGIRNRFKLK